MSRKHLPLLLFLFLCVLIGGLAVKMRHVGQEALPVMAPLTQDSLPPARPFNAESLTLPNGLVVVAIPNQRAAVVSHMLWYKVGAADETPGKSGLAHFFEHLMFKGTDRFPDDAFSSTVARLGGNNNAFTTQDATAYYVNISRQHLEKIMEMEADRMTHLTLDDKVVESERQVVMEERRQRIDNNPAFRFREELMEKLYPGHAYGRPTIGYAPEIEQLNRTNATDFYRQWYAPNNAVLVVAGDITLDELIPLAEKYFGPIPAQPASRQPLPPAAPVPAPLRLERADPQVQAPMITRYYRVPANSRALEILAEIVGGSTTSRLYRSLVVEQKLASSAGVSYDALSRTDDSLLTVYLQPLPAVTVTDAEKALDAEIARLLAGGVTPEEVETAKKRLTTSAIYARDSLQGPAMLFGQMLSVGLALADVEEWSLRIARTAPDDVNAAIKPALQGPSAPVTGILLPMAATPGEQP